MPKNIPPPMSRENLNEALDKNMKSPEFISYIGACVGRWDDIKAEMEVMDCIIDTICKHYKINEEELVTSREQTMARSLMFYAIKKNLDNLSFRILADMFDRHKSYVKKAYDDMEFAIERHKTVITVEPFQKIQKALQKRGNETAPVMKA